MQAATHTITRGGRHVYVVGLNPFGPRGGTSGNIVDGIHAATGRAVRIASESALSPETIHAMVQAIGQPIEITHRQAIRLLVRGDELAAQIAIASGALKLAQEKGTARAVSMAAAKAAEPIDYSARIGRAGDGVTFDGVFFAASRNAAGTVCLDRAALQFLRSAGISGQSLGHAYSQMQKAAA